MTITTISSHKTNMKERRAKTFTIIIQKDKKTNGTPKNYQVKLLQSLWKTHMVLSKIA